MGERDPPQPAFESAADHGDNEIINNINTNAGVTATTAKLHDGDTLPAVAPTASSTFQTTALTSTTAPKHVAPHEQATISSSSPSVSAACTGPAGISPNSSPRHPGHGAFAGLLAEAAAGLDIGGLQPPTMMTAAATATIAVLPVLAEPSLLADTHVLHVGSEKGSSPDGAALPHGVLLHAAIAPAPATVAGDVVELAEAPFRRCDGKPRGGGSGEDSDWQRRDQLQQEQKQQPQLQPCPEHLEQEQGRGQQQLPAPREGRCRPDWVSAGEDVTPFSIQLPKRLDQKEEQGADDGSTPADVSDHAARPAPAEVEAVAAASSQRIFHRAHGIGCTTIRSGALGSMADVDACSAAAAPPPLLAALAASGQAATGNAPDAVSKLANASAVMPCAVASVPTLSGAMDAAAAASTASYPIRPIPIRLAAGGLPRGRQAGRPAFGAAMEDASAGTGLNGDAPGTGLLWSTAVVGSAPAALGWAATSAAAAAATGASALPARAATMDAGAEPREGGRPRLETCVNEVERDAVAPCSSASVTVSGGVAAVAALTAAAPTAPAGTEPQAPTAVGSSVLRPLSKAGVEDGPAGPSDAPAAPPPFPHPQPQPQATAGQSTAKPPPPPPPSKCVAEPDATESSGGSGGSSGVHSRTEGIAAGGHFRRTAAGGLVPAVRPFLHPHFPVTQPLPMPMQLGVMGSLYLQAYHQQQQQQDKEPDVGAPDGESQPVEAVPQMLRAPPFPLPPPWPAFPFRMPMPLVPQPLPPEALLPPPQQPTQPPPPPQQPTQPPPPPQQPTQPPPPPQRDPERKHELTHAQVHPELLSVSCTQLGSMGGALEDPNVQPSRREPQPLSQGEDSSMAAPGRGPCYPHDQYSNKDCREPDAKGSHIKAKALPPSLPLLLQPAVQQPLPPTAAITEFAVGAPDSASARATVDPDGAQSTGAAGIFLRRAAAALGCQEPHSVPGAHTAPLADGGSLAAHTHGFALIKKEPTARDYDSVGTTAAAVLTFNGATPSTVAVPAAAATGGVQREFPLGPRVPAPPPPQQQHSHYQQLQQQRRRPTAGGDTAAAPLPRQDCGAGPRYGQRPAGADGTYKYIVQVGDKWRAQVGHMEGGVQRKYYSGYVRCAAQAARDADKLLFKLRGPAFPLNFPLSEAERCGLDSLSLQELLQQLHPTQDSTALIAAAALLDMSRHSHGYSRARERGIRLRQHPLAYPQPYPQPSSSALPLQPPQRPDGTRSEAVAAAAAVAAAEGVMVAVAAGGAGARAAAGASGSAPPCFHRRSGSNGGVGVGAPTAITAATLVPAPAPHLGSAAGVLPTSSAPLLELAPSGRGRRTVADGSARRGGVASGSGDSSYATYDGATKMPYISLRGRSGDNTDDGALKKEAGGGAGGDYRPGVYGIQRTAGEGDGGKQSAGRGREGRAPTDRGTGQPSLTAPPTDAAAAAAAAAAMPGTAPAEAPDGPPAHEAAAHEAAAAAATTAGAGAGAGGDAMYDNPPDDVSGHGPSDASGAAGSTCGGCGGGGPGEASSRVRARGRGAVAAVAAGETAHAGGDAGTAPDGPQRCKDRAGEPRSAATTAGAPAGHQQAAAPAAAAGAAAAASAAAASAAQALPGFPVGGFPFPFPFPFSFPFPMPVPMPLPMGIPPPPPLALQHMAAAAAALAQAQSQSQMHAPGHSAGQQSGSVTEANARGRPDPGLQGTAGPDPFSTPGYFPALGLVPPLLPPAMFTQPQSGYAAHLQHQYPFPLHQQQHQPEACGSLGGEAWLGAPGGPHPGGHGASYWPAPEPGTAPYGPYGQPAHPACPSRGGRDREGVVQRRQLTTPGNDAPTERPPEQQQQQQQPHGQRQRKLNHQSMKKQDQRQHRHRPVRHRPLGGEGRKAAGQGTAGASTAGAGGGSGGGDGGGGFGGHAFGSKYRKRKVAALAGSNSGSGSGGQSRAGSDEECGAAAAAAAAASGLEPFPVADHRVQPTGVQPTGVQPTGVQTQTQTHVEPGIALTTAAGKNPATGGAGRMPCDGGQGRTTSHVQNGTWSEQEQHQPPAQQDLRNKSNRLPYYPSHHQLQDHQAHGCEQMQRLPGNAGLAPTPAGAAALPLATTETGPVGRAGGAAQPAAPPASSRQPERPPFRYIVRIGSKWRAQVGHTEDGVQRKYYSNYVDDPRVAAKDADRILYKLRGSAAVANLPLSEAERAELDAMGLEDLMRSFKADQRANQQQQ